MTIFKYNNLLQSFGCILSGYKIHLTTSQNIKYFIDAYQKDLNNIHLVITREIYLKQGKCDELDVLESVIDIFGECDNNIFTYISY